MRNKNKKRTVVFNEFLVFDLSSVFSVTTLLLLWYPLVQHMIFGLGGRSSVEKSLEGYCD